MGQRKFAFTSMRSQKCLCSGTNLALKVVWTNDKFSISAFLPCNWQKFSLPIDGTQGLSFAHRATLAYLCLLLDH